MMDHQFEEENLNISLSELFNNINIGDNIGVEYSELDTLILQANRVRKLKQSVNSIFTTVEELKNISIELRSYGYDVQEYTDRATLLNDISISVEGIMLLKIKDRIMEIIKKIIEIIKNLISINRILAIMLDKELKTGVLSSIQSKTNQTSFNSIISPFYPKEKLSSSIKILSSIRYIEDLSEKETLEEALPTDVIKSMKDMGWIVTGNSLLKKSEKELSLSLIKLGWRIEDIPIIARNVNVLLMTNLINGRRDIKTFEKKVKDTIDIDQATKLRRKLLHIQRTINIVQDIGVVVAWCIIFLCRKLKSK
jgi:hypothetical protein